MAIFAESIGIFMKNIVKSFLIIVSAICIMGSCNKIEEPARTQVYWEVEKDIKYPLWDLYSQQGYDNILFGQIISTIRTELIRRGFKSPQVSDANNMYIDGLKNIAEGESLAKEAMEAVSHEYYGKKLFTYTGERSATINIFINHIDGKNSEHGKPVCSLTFY